jgi:predicted transcriptional regulator YdeE
MQAESMKKVQKPETHVIGIACRTANTSDAAPIDIPRLWQRFYAENILSQIPNSMTDHVIALYCDYEGDYSQPYTCVIGCRVSSIEEVPEGMVAKTIPASTFAVYEAVGEFPQSVLNVWNEVWQSTTLKRTYAGDYEIYGKRFFIDASKPVSIYVAIEE